MTIKYFLNDDTLANPVHAADTESEMNETQGGASTVTASIAAEVNEAAHTWTTPTSVPNLANWDSGTYFWSYDAVTVGSNITHGFTTSAPFNLSGHLGRIDASSDIDTVSVGASSGTGVKNGNTSWTPASGNASDRLEALLWADNAAMHGAETLEIATGDTNSFINTPFTVAAVDTFEKSQNINQAVNRSNTY